MHGDRLRAAFESRDLEQLLGLLDENVLWRGLRQPDGETPICRNRSEVREIFVRFLEHGGTGNPIVVGEAGDSVVVDPRPEPAPPIPTALHQVFTFRGPCVVLMQDYPDHASALASIGIS